MAGGLLGGSGVISGLALFRPDVVYLLLGLVPPLFAVGALGGFTLGAGLGWLARSGRRERSRYSREMCVAVACAVPGLAGAAAITFWIAYPTVLASAGRTRWIIVASFGWAAALFVFGWAVTEGRKAIRLVTGARRTNAARGHRQDGPDPGARQPSPTGEY